MNSKLDGGSGLKDSLGSGSPIQVTEDNATDRINSEHSQLEMNPDSEDRYYSSIQNIIEKASVNLGNFIQEKLPERKTFLSPWLRESTFTLVSGARGIGKTWFGLSIGVSLTHKQPIGSWPVETPTNVLYIDGEMNENELQERLNQLTRGLIPVAEFNLLSADRIARLGYKTPNLVCGEWQHGMSQYLAEHPEYRVLIIDNISALFPGLDENDKHAWDPQNQWFLNLRRQRVSTILLHHHGKNINKGPRGTSARDDNTDCDMAPK